jgi:hypothetical protein
VLHGSLLFSCNVALFTVRHEEGLFASDPGVMVSSDWQGYSYPWGYVPRVCEGRGQGMKFLPSKNPYPYGGYCYVLVQAYALKERCCDLTSA